MSDILRIITSIIGLLSIIGIVYSLFAGVWGFNPTNISWFNTKICITSILVFFIALIVTKD